MNRLALATRSRVTQGVISRRLEGRGGGGKRAHQKEKRAKRAKREKRAKRLGG
jgi:hypothetical protein